MGCMSGVLSSGVLSSSPPVVTLREAQAVVYRTSLVFSHEWMEVMPPGRGYHRGDASRALFSAHHNWGTVTGTCLGDCEGLQAVPISLWNS